MRIGLIDIYLPIADIKLDALVLIALGVLTGLVGGLFGLGGGIIAVPALTILGVPPMIAVTTATNQMTAGTLSSCLTYAHRGRVDFKLGWIMLIGGVFGTIIGIMTFVYLEKIGVIDTFISVSFFIITTLIIAKSLQEILSNLYTKARGIERPEDNINRIFTRLPFRMKFTCIKTEISIIAPLIIGFAGGFLVLMLGIGGGFVMIPAMLFLLKADERFLSGTMQLQIVFTSIISTLLHANSHQNMDIILCIFLIIGTVFGSQIGARLGMRIEPKKFKFLLIIMFLIIALKLGINLFARPDSLYTVDIIGY